MWSFINHVSHCKSQHSSLETTCGNSMVSPSFRTPDSAVSLVGALVGAFVGARTTAVPAAAVRWAAAWGGTMAIAFAAFSLPYTTFLGPAAR